MAARKKAAKKKTAKRAKKIPLSEGGSYGRPSIFTPEMGEEICKRIAGGMSLRRICLEDDDMPDAATVRRWILGQGIPDGRANPFCANYEDARQKQADHYFDEIIDIPDEARNRDSAGVAASKVRADARKWVLARMNRAKFGDQSNLNIGGQSDAPPIQTESVDVTHMDPADLAKLRELGRKAIQSSKED